MKQLKESVKWALVSSEKQVCYESFSSFLCYTRDPKNFLDVLINHHSTCKMSWLLELHESKLAEIDGALTCKLHRCLCQCEVEVKLDLLDLATFLSPLWTDFVVRKWPDKVLSMIWDSVSPHSVQISFCSNTNSPKASVLQEKLNTCGEKRPLCVGQSFVLAYTPQPPLTPVELECRGLRAASFLHCINTSGMGHVAEERREKGLDWQTGLHRQPDNNYK